MTSTASTTSDVTRLQAASAPEPPRRTPHALSWLRLSTSLARSPRSLIGRGCGLAGDLAGIARGTSTRQPARADKRFADPA